MANSVVVPFNKAESSTSFVIPQNWCCGGSGKKYKRCGLLETEEHRKLMSKK